MTRLTLRLACIVSLAGAAIPVPAWSDAHMSAPMVAKMADTSGTSVGTVTLTPTASGTALVALDLKGLEPGWHAFHIHETGSCEDSFKAAGGHLAGDAQHGVSVEGGPHAGDLPNQMVAADGTLQSELFANTALKLTGEGSGVVADADGSAFIIHAGRDDYSSQPAGDAGDRVACGIIEMAK